MYSHLVYKAKRDPAAFGELYEKYYNAVYKYIYVRTKKQTLTEDIVSTAWEKALHKIHTLTSNDGIVFTAWIFTIARNALYEHFRHKHHIQTVPIEDYDPPSTEQTDAQVKQKEIHTQITIVMQALPSLQREIVSLRFFGDMKNKEIAGVIGTTEQIVAVNLSRALKTMHKRMEFLL